MLYPHTRIISRHDASPLFLSAFSVRLNREFRHSRHESKPMISHVFIILYAVGAFYVDVGVDTSDEVISAIFEKEALD